jgi:hypothetical protein
VWARSTTTISIYHFDLQAKTSSIGDLVKYIFRDAEFSSTSIERQFRLPEFAGVAFSIGGVMMFLGIAPGNGKGKDRGPPAIGGGGGGGTLVRLGSRPAFCNDANNEAGSRLAGGGGAESPASAGGCMEAIDNEIGREARCGCG